MTDERLGERLWSAIDRVPRNDGGIVFRHYSLPRGARQLLAERVADVAKRRGITLAIAADVELVLLLRAALVHNPEELPCPLPFSKSVHSVEQAEAARLRGAALVFVSPVHPTASHPGGKPLGEALALRIARLAGVPAIALGDMNTRNFAQLERKGFYGWAGIDAWT